MAKLACQVVRRLIPWAPRELAFSEQLLHGLGIHLQCPVRDAHELQLRRCFQETCNEVLQCLIEVCGGEGLDLTF